MWKEHNWGFRKAHKHPCYVIQAPKKKKKKITIVPNLKQVTCNTALSKKTACMTKVTTTSISFLNVWVGNSWMATVRWNPWTENRCGCISTTYQRERLSHTAFWRSLAHKSCHLSRPTGWQASWALPILSSFSLSRPGTVMPSACHKDSTLRWEKLRKCIENVKESKTTFFKIGVTLIKKKWCYLVIYWPNPREATSVAIRIGALPYLNSEGRGIVIQ